ncbi:hypothetical protein AKO1_006947 [Acrasis kona]|uniref:Nucleotidyltransferase family protein n=1 Tax=Acrasis kona TaxID=1008807 RepID=A0AAW2YUZ8_9EUKA
MDAHDCRSKVILTKKQEDFYKDVLAALRLNNFDFLLGGTLAYSHYTGVKRHTKDLDIFVRPHDFDKILLVLNEKGFEVEKTFPHWLGKIYRGKQFIDVIYRSANGDCEVDDGWFDNSVEGTCLGLKVMITPPEEMIWSKAAIMEKERFDGADVNHIIKAIGTNLNWDRLVERFGPRWRVLFAHCVLFGFVYRSERDCIPNWVMEHFQKLLQQELQEEKPNDNVCYGPILSRAQYLTDVNRWGYRDARKELKMLTQRDINLWTSAIPDVECYDQCESSPRSSV